jgi:hypothetical protein
MSRYHFIWPPSVGWVPSLCPETWMCAQNLQIWVSIVCCNVIYNFLLLPHADAGGEGDPGRTSTAAVGAVLIAPVIHKQAILCNLLSSAWLVLNLTLGHHIVAVHVTMGLTTSVYIQYTNLWFQSQSFPKWASTCPEGFVDLVSDLIWLLFPSQSLL